MKALAALLGATVLAAIATPANAAIYLALQSDGVNGGAITFVASDGGTGTLTYGADYGNFSNSIIIQGAPKMAQPMLQSAAINTTTSAAGVLNIYVTQTDLNPYSGGIESSFTANSFLGDVQSVALSTFYSNTNASPRNGGAFNPGTQLASTTFTDLGARKFVGNVATTAPWSETAKYTLTFGGAASANNTVNVAAVPEPASWAMMIGGVGMVGGVMRRRKAVTTRVAFA